MIHHEQMGSMLAFDPSRCGADLSAMGDFDIPSINMSLLVLAASASELISVAIPGRT